jgi:hypothetical protein
LGHHELERAAGTTTTTRQELNRLEIKKCPQTQITTQPINNNNNYHHGQQQEESSKKK